MLIKIYMIVCRKPIASNKTELIMKLIIDNFEQLFSDLIKTILAINNFIANIISQT